MTRKRTMNQLGLAPMRIPEMRTSWMEPPPNTSYASLWRVTLADMDQLEHYLIDMDGVLVHEEDPLPGAQEFLGAIRAAGKGFLVLTNNSIYTPRDLARAAAGERDRRARRVALDVGAGDRAVPRRPAAQRLRATSSARPVSPPRCTRSATR